MIDVEKTIAAREARKVAKAEQVRQEQEQRHSQARADFKERMRQAYPGDTQTFNATVWPSLRDQWERDQVVDGVEVTIADLMAKHRYHGF